MTYVAKSLPRGSKYELTALEHRADNSIKKKGKAPITVAILLGFVTASKSEMDFHMRMIDFFGTGRFS